MKIITTKRQTNERYRATDNDGNTVIVARDYSKKSEVMHVLAAIALCEKMDWHGELVEGSSEKTKMHYFVWLAANHSNVYPV